MHFCNFNFTDLTIDLFVVKNQFRDVLIDVLHKLIILLSPSRFAII